MNNHKKIDISLKATLILLALFPILYLNRIENVPFKAFILGAGSWGIGMIFKMIAHQLVVVHLSKRHTSLLWISFVNGFLSGLFELAAALGIILIMEDKFPFDFMAIISFGLAIGSLESIIFALNSKKNLLEGTTLEKTTIEINKSLENEKGIKLLVFEYLYPVLERILATFLHISTRGLIFVSILSSTYYPFLIALSAFIIADGFLGYYFNISGKLIAAKGFVQLYVALFMLTLFVTIVFFVLFSPLKNNVL